MPARSDCWSRCSGRRSRSGSRGSIGKSSAVIPILHRHPREGGDPASFQRLCTKTLDPRLRGDDEPRCAGIDFPACGTPSLRPLRYDPCPVRCVTAGVPCLPSFPSATSARPTSRDSGR
ncbi:hypothetical protein FQY83_02675 [Luteimonas marina]|uniref:Uncharacterized protein n=1 Tax=Luteimonas marina TaxID=488485 RepID=A0A5C5UB45_9GAMM|nr:hypothetical protein FQY83_02675 [Luteimonas marina]